MTTEEGTGLDIGDELLKGKTAEAHVRGEVQVTQDSGGS